VKVELVKISQDRWRELESSAHLSVFGELLPPEYDRVDFALLAVEKTQNQPVAYLTARELDAESVYLKYGGAFPPIKSTVNSVFIYREMMQWLQERYRRITTLVENTNTVYLKMALTVGFRPIGIRQFKNSLLVELFLGEEN
jgi:hypothetical protein